MQELPFQLHYDLDRGQRLIPHLALWGPISLLIVALCAGVVWFALSTSVWFAILLLPVMWFFSGFFLGLLDVAFCPVRSMDIVVEENGLGFLAGGERWFVFLDGVSSIRRYRDDVWTILHWNGTVINIPVSAITDDQLQCLKTAVAAARDRASAAIAKHQRTGESSDDNSGPQATPRDDEKAT